jgi:hypothetical protein
MAIAIGGLDQQAGSTRPKDTGRKSVNSHAGCLKVLDTRRPPAVIAPDVVIDPMLTRLRPESITAVA